MKSVSPFFLLRTQAIHFSSVWKLSVLQSFSLSFTMYGWAYKWVVLWLKILAPSVFVNNAASNCKIYSTFFNLGTAKSIRPTSYWGQKSVCRQITSTDAFQRPNSYCRINWNSCKFQAMDTAVMTPTDQSARRYLKSHVTTSLRSKKLRRM